MPAGLLRRLACLAYEALLLVAVLFVAGLAFTLSVQGLGEGVRRTLFQLYLLAIAGAYFTYFWSDGRQTLAMRTWRLKVVTVTGEPLGARRAAIRFLFAVWSLALAGIGFAWALIDPEHAFLHDRLAGTRLVTIAPDRAPGSAPLDPPEHRQSRTEEQQGREHRRQ